LATPSSPIVVLDSGLGGLTVVRALRSALPREEIVYFGDTARVPYGTKTGTTVTSFVRQIITYLSKFDPKHIVFACNTATALALPTLRAEFPQFTMSGVIEPAAKAAVAAGGSKEVPIIGVIATEATIRSRAYERAIHRRRSHARLLLRPTPLLVPIIEEGRKGDDPLIKLAIKQYLAPMIERKLDVLVLGCTHYPMLKHQIMKLVGPAVRVIDCGEHCAQDVARRLHEKGLVRHMNTAGTTAPSGGSLKCFVTDDTPRFAKLASRFLGVEISEPTWVAPDELYTEDDRPAAQDVRRAS
jgi:glutamate racemase